MQRIPAFAISALMSCSCMHQASARTTSESISTSASTKQSIETILKSLSSDTFAGRESLTPGGKAAREWLKAWLNNHHAVPSGTAEGSFEQPFDQGVNLIAIIPSKTNDATIAIKPRVILSAHYDHWGVTCKNRAEAHSKVCNGAADNAGGVAVVLAAAEILATKTNAPVAVTLWDAEEKGLLGSKYFVSNPTFDMTDVQLMINMDIVGLNLFKGLESNHFMMGSETGGKTLMDDALQAASSSTLRIRSFSYAIGDRRSDMTSFIRGGIKIPVIFFSDGDGSIYHTDADEYQVINFTKIAAVAELVARLTNAATKREHTQSYQFQSPQFANGIALPVFSDVKTLQELTTSVLSMADLNQLSLEQKALLTDAQKKLNTIATAGPGAFNAQAMQQLALIITDITKLSRGLVFIP